MSMRTITCGAICCAMALVIVGCGGSGGSVGGGGSIGGGGGGGAAASSTMYLTADASGSFSHMWVTVTGVTLMNSRGQSISVYNGSSTGGQVVDLSSLNASNTNYYHMLAGFHAPAGTYTGATITCDSTASVVSAGGSSASTVTFAGASGGSASLSAKFGSAQSVSGNFALDFNLGNWTIGGGMISARNGQWCSLGSTLGLGNPATILSGDYLGVASNLSGTAPSQTFTITRGGFSVNVMTSSSTVLYNSDGSANPTLSNGETVDVAGTFDPTAKVVDATAVIIEVSTNMPEVRFNGLVTADSQTAGTLSVQLKLAIGWMPVAATVTVNVDSNTTFVDSSGVTDTEAQFYSSLTAGTSKIQVEGTIQGGDIDATVVQILPTGSSSDHLVAVRGTVSNVNTTADSFSLTVAKWEGHRIPMGTMISVVTTADTQFAVDGTVENAATFFASLPGSSSVNVRGTYDTSTMTLTAAIVTQGPGNGGGFHF